MPGGEWEVRLERDRENYDDCLDATLTRIIIITRHMPAFVWSYDDAETDEGESQWGLKWNIIGIKMCQRDWLTRQAPESRSAATLGSLLFAVRLHSLSRSLIQGSFNRTAALTSTRCLKDRPNPTQPNPCSCTNLGHCQPDTATSSFVYKSFEIDQQNPLKFPRTDIFAP